MANHKYYEQEEEEEEETYFGQYRPLRTKGLDQKEKRKPIVNDYWDYED